MIDEQQLIRTILAEQVRVLAYIQSIVRRADVADDIFQEVCALAVEKRSQINDQNHLRHWLRTTARFESLAALRKRRVEHLSLDPATLDALDRHWHAERFADSSSYAELLRQCVKSLSKPHQLLVTKRFFDGWDYERLAADLNRTVDSLYVTFSRIYAALGKCIAQRADV